MKTIEICTNNEALGFDNTGTGYTSKDLGTAFRNSLCRSISSSPLLFDCDYVWAGGNRCLLDGWKGAKFSYRGLGWGSFAELTSDEERELDRLSDLSAEEVESMICESLIPEPDDE